MSLQLPYSIRCKTVTNYPSNLYQISGEGGGGGGESQGTPISIYETLTHEYDYNRNKLAQLFSLRKVFYSSKSLKFHIIFSLI